MLTFKAIYRLLSRAFLSAAFILPLAAGLARPVAAENNEPGAVYTQSNSAAGNEILVYARSAEGTLAYQDAFATGGAGSGAGLGSQGSVVLSENGRWLYSVNAGSNQVSVFSVKKDGLELVTVADSGGVMPISLTVHKRLLYVLNGGGSGNITGFSIGSHGELTPLAGSTQPLSNGGVGAAPGGAQISFSPDGDTLVVTEKATNLIDAYRVQHGLASAPVSYPSSGATPFGFAFNSRGILVVSEAFGGQPGLSALSSYDVEDGVVNVVSPSVATTQTAACWVVISKNDKFAYTTNAGSGTISSYRIAHDGSLTLLEAAAGITGNGSSPIDMAINNSGQFLYALNAGAHTVSMFQMQADGGLVSLGEIAVPVGAVGLAAH